MKQTHKYSGPSCLYFLLLAFPCEIVQIFADSKQNNHPPPSPRSRKERGKQPKSSSAAACSTCVQHPQKDADRAAVSHSEAETAAQTSLHVTQDYRLHTSPVSRDVINYTYIDRNSIHYSWAAQRQRYFPPFEHDEKILNNSPPFADVCIPVESADAKEA